MNASWGSKLTPQVAIVLLILAATAVITSAAQIILQIKTKTPSPAKVALMTAFFVVSTLALAMLGNFLFSTFSVFLGVSSPPDTDPLPTTSTQSVDHMAVSASYEYFSFANADAIIQARTTVAATRVIMSWSNMNGSSDSCPMHSIDNINWFFFADFFESGTFEIVITAYDESWQSVSTVLNVPSPVFSI